MLSRVKTFSENLSEIELRAFFDKHDGNKSGTLEWPEARALLDDVRILYGLPAPLTKQQADSVLKSLDKEGQNDLSWNEIRLLTGKKAATLKRVLKRAKSNKAKAQTWTEWVVGESAEVADVEVKRDKNAKPIELIFHPLRATGLVSSASILSSFAPVVEIRIVSGDPWADRKDNRGPEVLYEPFVAQATSQPASTETLEPTWSDPVRLSVVHNEGLYVHGFVCEDGMFGPNPLADFSIHLDRLVKAPEGGVHELPLHGIASDRVEKGAKLVASYGGTEHPRARVAFHVVRALGLDEGADLVVEASLRGRGSEQPLVSARTEASTGPNPVFNTPLTLEWPDEGMMTVTCRLLQVGWISGEEAVAELETAIPVSEWADGSSAAPRRLCLRPLGGATSSGPQLLLCLGAPRMVSLIVRPTSASSVFPPEGCFRFDPFFEVAVTTGSPIGHAAGVVTVAGGVTETVAGCNTNEPFWEEPILLPEFVYEPNMYVHFKVCAERFASDPDVLAEGLVPLDEALGAAKNPIEKKYQLTPTQETQRRTEPFAYVMFADREHGGRLVPVQRPKPQCQSQSPHGSGPSRPAGAVDQPGDRPGPGGGRACGWQDQAAAHDQQAPKHGGAPQRFQLSQEIYNQEVDEKLEPYRAAAAKRGGSMRGMVPLSFLRARVNLHAVWLKPDTE